MQAMAGMRLGRSLAGVALALLYADALLRLCSGLFFRDRFGPLLSPLFASDQAAPPHGRTHRSQLVDPPPPPPPPPQQQALPSQAAATAVPGHEPPPHADGAPLARSTLDRDASCTRHEVLLGSLYADLQPWVDRRLKIDERSMRDAINFASEHRGKWDSWVTDTLTPVLIHGGKVYLTLGPPTKDPTNYFWTVLMELQQLATERRLPDTELLLNFADTPVVYASDDGSASLTQPRLPIFSYCKNEKALDILVPGYYSPDRVCKEYARSYTHPPAARHPWPKKLRRAFARYTHFCKPQSQKDVYGRKLPPCARSYFASLSASAGRSGQLDVHPMNRVNDTTDPSLGYGRKLLSPSRGLPMAEHGKFAYLLDTDGFTSAYKLQQLLATDSAVLHHRSPWRTYYYAALHEYVHYVPIWRSSSDDVLRTIDWLREHDEVGRRVAANGHHFACEHLTRGGRSCYWETAIREYLALQISPPSQTKVCAPQLPSR